MMSMLRRLGVIALLLALTSGSAAAINPAPAKPAILGWGRLSAGSYHTCTLTEDGVVEWEGPEPRVGAEVQQVEFWLTQYQVVS